MSTIWTPDYCFEQFLKNEQLIRAAVDCNEATVRMRAIDTVLFDVFGWSKLDVDPETYVRDEGFSDYVFSLNKSITGVLEAKRANEYFVLPSIKGSEAPIGFGLLAQECKPAHKAMVQAAGYAALLGARHVAISNGHQWLLALAWVHSQPLEHRLTMVFESVDAIKDRFRSFWRCFSPESAYSNYPAEILLESRKAPAPPKLSTMIPGYPVPANRNVLANEIGFVTRFIWDEVSDQEPEREFLEQCYVTPGISEDSLSLAKELISQRRQQDNPADALPLSVSDAPNLISSFSQARSLPERPIIVLGRVGHGKSTFLKHLRLVKAQKDLAKYIQIEIDFIDRPDVKADVRNYTYDCVDEQLVAGPFEIDIQDDAFSRAVLHSDLARFRKSAEAKPHLENPSELLKVEAQKIKDWQADRYNYLKRVFRHLRAGRGHSVAIFFDNLDRRYDGIPEEAFLLASAVARDWEALVFVCLRPSTFFLSKESGVLDAIAPKTIAVAPPKTNALLKRRFSFAKTVALGNADSEHSSTFRRPPPSRDVSLSLPRVARFLECCEQSFGTSKKLTDVFDAASNGNVRDLLRYVREFICSQHLNTEKILQELEVEGEYIIPDFEAVRALLYGDYLHFDPTQSVFVNLFDINRSDRAEHFTRFVALEYLLSTTASERQHVKPKEVVQYLSQLGFSSDHSTETLKYLHSKKCIEHWIPELKWDEAMAIPIRITSLGAFHITRLAPQFAYYDAIVVDTPICDEAVRAVITDGFEITKRVTRCRELLAYLEVSAEALHDGRASNVVKDVFRTALTDCDRVEQRARERLEDSKPPMKRRGGI